MRAPDLPQEGDELFVTIGPVKAFGVVVRAREPEFAMAFDEPLGTEDLEILKDNVRAARGLPPDVKADPVPEYLLRNAMRVKPGLGLCWATPRRA